MVEERKVALVGAGYIAEFHAEVLSGLDGVRLAAIVDPAIERARALAGKWRIPKVLPDVEALIAAGGIDTAHILVPPPLHRPIAETLLRAGIDVLIEKPMAESAEDCIALQDAAGSTGAALHVNQNFVHHPAHRVVSDTIRRGEIGRLRHVTCHFNMPLAQFTSRQFSHWMFNEPKNLLLEQAVHPLSQIEDLIGPIGELSVTAAPPRHVAEGIDLRMIWLVSMLGMRGSAQLQVALGQTFPAWGLTALCDDGIITADYVNNRVTRQEPSPYMDFWDSYLSGHHTARDLRRQSRRNLVDYVRSTLKLKPRTDYFYRSMTDSIRSFYQMLDGDRAALDGAFGRHMVELCERIAAKVPDADRPPRVNVIRSPLTSNRRADVLVIGGTGFIGQHVVGALRRQHHTVAVMARGTANLPAPFHDPGIVIQQGDVRRDEDVRQVIDGIPVVINLAHGGGAETWPALRHAIVGGARRVAEACLDAGTERLIHCSSIAALALGDPGATITGATPPDPDAAKRNFYTRAKAEAEELLLDLHRTRGLPVTILRPGVVVGEGGIAFHSGIGLYNRERDCLGWNRGDNPLPLVLVEDVANAVERAMSSPNAIGRCYNVVGDVRLTAREYTALLAQALRRPLRYHPQTLTRQYAEEVLKWLVKIAIGRRDASFPLWSDLASRGLVAHFDTSDIKSDLGWYPVADRQAFVQQAFSVHAD